MTKLAAADGEALAQRETVKTAIKRAERAEEKMEAGLAPRQAKTQTLDTGRFSVIFPGRKARYVRTGDATESRLADGWQYVSEEDAKKAGKRTMLGTQYVLMWLPQERVANIHKANLAKNRRLLEAAKRGDQFKADVAREQAQLAASGVIAADKSLLSDESDGPFDDK